MKSYNIKEIAEMLNTNPETVRRWIRNKKLHADMVSKQEGTSVSEKDLINFLLENPKYRSIAILGAFSPFGLPIGASVGVGAFVAAALSYKDQKSNSELRISSKDLVPLVRSEVTKMEETKAQIEKEIRIKQDELSEVNERIANFKLYIQKFEKEEK